MRMSDLVRGIHRKEEPPPSPEAPPARPASGAAPPAEEVPSPRRLRFPTAPVARPARAAPDSEASAPAKVSPAEAEPRERAEQLFGELLAFAGGVPALARGGREFPWQGLHGLVERAMRSLQGSAELLSLADAPPPAGVEYLPAHLTRVGILSLGIGVGLGWDPEQLLDLGMAGFLFDVGMVESLGQNHVQLSTDILRRWAPPQPGMVEAVLQHHERENGRGYPRGLAGSAIHPNAKIIGLTDTYMALIFPRPPGHRLPPHEAIREMVRSRHEGFPPELVKALLAEISLFPPRTVVQLNTGEVGRVIAINRNHPMRPRVEVLADSKGNRVMALKILDLAEAPFIYVTGPVQEGGGG